MRYSIIFAVSIFIIFPALAFSATLKVPSQYQTIQDAIDASVNGDTVLVEPGTYVDYIDFKGKAITVTSEQGVKVTVIDGNQAGSVVTCQSGEGADTVLDGFTIVNGSGTSIGGDHYGGGMYNFKSSPTVTNCAFSGNWATSFNKAFGGGMYNDHSSPTVANCTFFGNSAEGKWQFPNPGNGYGGGMYNNSSSPMLTNCIFCENFAVGLNADGGGMYNKESSPSVISCTFSNNYSSGAGALGGGMLNSDSHPIVTNCTFAANWTEDDGAGMCNSDSSPTITNCIFWNVYDEIANGGTSSPIVTYTCIKGGYPGTGNIDSDPLLVDPANNDIHLTFNSPCRASGDNTAVLDIYDFEGDPRIAYGTVDMGADEFYTHLYWTGDATPGGNVEVKFVGLPGTSPVGLCIGTGVLDPPLKSMWGDWYLQFPIIGPVIMPSIPTTGVSIVPGTIPATPPPPYSLPMQALVGAELTNVSVMEVK